MMNDSSKGALTLGNSFSNCTALFWLATAAVLLGCSLQHGLSLGILANTMPLIKEEFNVSYVYMSFIASGNALGASLGAAMAGYVADRLGRRKALLLNSLFFSFGWSLMAGAPSQHCFMVGRVAVGVGMGAGSVLANMFLSEIPPVSIRGFIGSLFGIVGALGTLVSILISMPQVTGDSDVGWRLVFAFPILPVLFQDIVLMVCPDTPQYLASIKQEMEGAVVSLSKFRKVVSEEEVNDLNVMDGKDDPAEDRVLTFREILSDSGHRLALLIGIILHFARQFSGASAVHNYTPKIFEAANVSDPVLGTAGMGLVNIFAGGAAVLLSDRMGRRFLMITGISKMVLGLVGIGVSQTCNATERLLIWSCGGGWTGPVALVSVFVYIAGFSLSLGSTIWLYINEITAPKARGKTNMVCLAVTWGLEMVVLLTYDSIDKRLNPHTFFLYAGTLTLFLILIVFMMPETSKKPIHQVCQELREQSKRSPPIAVYLRGCGAVHSSNEGAVRSHHEEPLPRTVTGNIQALHEFQNQSKTAFYKY